MKVMMDYQTFFGQEYGGVSRYHIELAKALKALGVSTEFSVTYSVNEYLKEYLLKKKRVYSANKLIRKIERGHDKYINRARCKLDAKKCDVIHLTWTDPYLLNCARGKVVATVHDMIHELLWQNRASVKKEIDNKKQVIYKADAIISDSENTKKDIISIYPDIDPEKIHVVYLGTNHLPAPQRPSFDVPNDYLLFVGQRGDYKNFSFLINTLADYLKKNKDLKLVVVGGGAFKEDELQMIDELGLKESIIHTTVSDAELAYLYNHARCFVYPTLYEGFGFPILEAFDNNCPVVCTRSSSLPEVGGDAAVYYEPNDKNDFLEKIKMIVEDENCRSNYINRGKEQVRKFTWDKCASETYKVYEEVYKSNRMRRK